MYFDISVTTYSFVSYLHLIIPYISDLRTIQYCFGLAIIIYIAIIT